MSCDSRSVWRLLVAERDKLASIHLRDLFSSDHTRGVKFSLEAAALFLDYAKQRVLPSTIDLLCRLAEAADLAARREAMFSGEIINTTEQRAVLHTALRDLGPRPIFISPGKENIKIPIRQVLDRIAACSEGVRNGKWLGFTGQPIKAIVNIGIGGSDLGPAMAVKALAPYVTHDINFYFVSNIDPSHISEVLRLVQPETTLFIIASKTFTTQETLCNAETARHWLLQKADNAALALARHFVAVTARPERAIEFGVDKTNIFPFWDWVGGRYSLWSAIGLSIAIAIGMENFLQFLAGAHAQDEHFKNAPFSGNMPVLLALLGIWNINFWQCATHAVIPYEQNLLLFPAYLQQLEMESNGKSVDIEGKNLNYATAPVVWGGVGTNGQHAFHQLLLQGKQTVPVDFICACRSGQQACSDDDFVVRQQRLLAANCLAQSQALMMGKTQEEVLAELLAGGMTHAAAKKFAPHKVIRGNIPSNTLMFAQLTPYALGSLIALYEHKVFVQGVIWQINSFDQWGVELGKKLTLNIAADLQKNKVAAESYDSSTGNLIRFYRENKIRPD